MYGFAAAISTSVGVAISILVNSTNPGNMGDWIYQHGGNWG